MSYQSLSEKLSLVTNLIEIAKADGFVNLSEVSYIFWTSQQLQLSELELERLFEKAAPLAVPISTGERVEVFHKCLTIVAIDNNLSEPEFDKCAQIAKDLRLEDKRVATSFELVRAKKGDLISLNELQSEFGLTF